MKKIKDWSNNIVRHFWHCASECRKDESMSDAEALREMKVHCKVYLFHIFGHTRIVLYLFHTYRTSGLDFCITYAIPMNG